MLLGPTGGNQVDGLPPAFSRVIRGRIELVSTFKLNDILKIFRVSFSYSEMFYAFVLRFGIFLIKFGWIDERMQSESSQGRLND